MMEIVLASSSVRRKRLLKSLGIKFKAVSPDIKENAYKNASAKRLAKKLALEKAKNVASRVKSGLIIGADTLVVCKKEIIGKPVDAGDSRRMLRKLSGTRHRVITGIALIEKPGGSVMVDAEESIVYFRKIPECEIGVLAGKHPDKAGAYAIQAKNDRFVKKLEGSYSNVVGLPVEKLKEMLKKMGGDSPWKS